MSTEGTVKIMAFLNKFRGGGKSPKSPKAPVVVDISSPCDMRHEIHVGWDNDGFLQGLPESWRSWMRLANIRYFKSCEDIKVRKFCRIGTVRYTWPMSAAASPAFSIAHCTDSEDLPKVTAEYLLLLRFF